MIIHLIWLGPRNATADASALAASRRWRRHDVRYHRDASELWPAWQGIYEKTRSNLHMASDFVRHSLLRRHPGLYLDMDVTLRVDPERLTESWQSYTAIMLEPTVYVGTDIIYVPPAWDRWSLFDDYIGQASEGNRFGYLDFAHKMILAAYLQDPSAITVIRDRTLYPCAEKDKSEAAVALRCGLSTGGLGDRVASALASVGITKERVSKALGKPCGCAKRQQRLNELGRRFGIG